MTAILFHFFILSLSLTSPSSPVPHAAWHTDFEAAQQEALQADKDILLVFSGSDWCKACIKLKHEVFETPDFASYAKDHWSLLNVDFPRSRKNKVSPEILTYRSSLAEKYNPQGLFPLVLILAADGGIKRQIVYKGGGLASFLNTLN